MPLTIGSTSFVGVAILELIRALISSVINNLFYFFSYYSSDMVTLLFPEPGLSVGSGSAE
uniref:Uncharacterized protein n=1 Tax=Oryza barthii TaxID=65489 RepID=A0A0D3G9C6_9ORYZ